MNPSVSRAAGYDRGARVGRAVDDLANNSGDCPYFQDLVAASIGVNLPPSYEYNDGGPDDDRNDKYWRIENDGEYLHFGGRDAHGSIRPGFWEDIELLTGKTDLKKAEYFSCSC